MTKPNFLIVGAARSGTTSLYHYLSQHPDIFLSPIKETNYFALEGQTLMFRGPGDQKAIGASSVTSWADYLQQFRSADGERAIGEASPSYMYYAYRTVPRILARIGTPKVIAILRNPVDRAFSNFSLLVRDGREPLRSFEEALKAEQERLNDGWEHVWAYFGLGLYGSQLEPFVHTFGRERLLILSYEDLLSDPVAMLQTTFRFLGVDPDFKPTVDVRHNAGGLPRRWWVHRITVGNANVKAVARRIVPRSVRRTAWRTLVAWNSQRTSIAPSTRHRLAAAYKDEIIKVGKLTGYDFTHWLEE